MTNQQIIRSLFNIPESESIFDDFGCSHNLIPGKLYVLENHLCFYSNFSGETKLIFEFNKIDSLIKTKDIIEAKIGNAIHKFSRFTDLHIAYKHIRASWISCCPDKDDYDSIINDSPDQGSATGSSLLKEEFKEETKVSLQKQGMQEEQKAPTEENKEPIPFINMDDPIYLEKSYDKHSKREHELFRLIFSFDAEEFSKRFIDPGCIFPDVKLYEIIGSKEIEDKGWEATEETCKKRTLYLNYKLIGGFFITSAYTIKNMTMTRTQ